MGWGAVSLGLLAVVGWFVAAAVAKSSLADALAEVRAAGFTTEFMELTPPPVPDDRNAAPLFVAAFALHPDPDGDHEVLGKAVDERFADLTAEEKAEACPVRAPVYAGV